MARLSSEYGMVQEPFGRYSAEIGWTFLAPEEALRLRGGPECPILRMVFLEQVQRLNPGVVTSYEVAEELLGRLLRVRPDIEGNLEAWEYLRGFKTVFVAAEEREKNVRLLDVETLENNTFHVTEEYRFTNGRFAIRPDIVFLINGIPVLVVEAKAATRREGLAEALDQIRRYHEEGPELMALTQVYGLIQTPHVYYGPTWNVRAPLNWRVDRKEDFETFVKAFVTPRRVIKMLHDYILFVRKDGELSKVVLRPHQMRATQKVVGRAADPKKRRGLVWHTQGSGKTFTMITVAKKLLGDPRFENPTVLMVVDRNELQQQLFQNLDAVGLKNVYVARSKRHLRQLLKGDTRGLIVTMIHKFDDADADLNTRKNIFVLIDEAHRTTGGDLGNYLMGALPNATFIGFTGTPIDKTAHGKGTFKVFGSEDSKRYLDKYSIRDSIEDGTTVPLHYQMAPNHLLIDREAMEQEFWAAAELEGVANVEEINRVLDRAVTLKNMLKNKDRVNQVAAFVAEHFNSFVDPMGYKAFLVAVDREACGLYKEALDRYLPHAWSEVVISRGHNDLPELKRYHLADEQEAEVRKRFRKPDEVPKILIVTEKLLTGYDAPILYAMYLDKPMRDHVLLQAIARVNRPHQDDEGRKKKSGLIMDFVGIFDNLERALAFDSQDIQGVVEGLDVLMVRFRDLMEEGRKDVLPIIAESNEDKAIEAVLERYRDEEERNAFYAFIRELQEIYEILSPDPSLRPFLEDYQKLIDIYRILRTNYEPHVPVDRSFLRKTASIVQKHSSITGIEDSTETHVLTPDAILALAKTDRPDTVKVFNLLRELHRLVEDKSKDAPHLNPTGERAEAIRRAFEQRQLTSQEALKELQELTKELKTAETERQESNLSPDAYTTYWWLRIQKHCDAEKALQIATSLDSAFNTFQNWRMSSTQESKLRRSIYKAYLNAGIKEAVTLANELLKMLRAKP